MRLPRFARRRVIIPAALLALALVSIVIYRWDRSTDQTSSLEVKRHIKLDDTGELLAWNPTGTLLATYSGETYPGEFDPHSAILWEPKSGTRRAVLRDIGPTYRLTWSPDAKKFATGSPYSKASLWDSATGKRLLTLSGHTARIYDLAWSPDGQTLATGAYDHVVILWDTQSGRAIATFKGHSTPVGDIRWSPDGKTLASVSDDGTLVWNPSAEGPQATLDGGWPRWSPDGKNLVTLDGKIAIIWDAKTLKERGRLIGHKNFIECLEWSPDGKLLATATDDPGGFWRGVLPDFVLGPGSAAIMWDATTLKARHVLTGHRHNIPSLTWSPDGRFLATGSWDQSVIIWDVSTGKRAATLTEGLDEVVNTVAWSPDGNFLATTFGSFSKRTILWEIVGTGSVAK